MTRSTSPAPATAGPAVVANAYLEGTYTRALPARRPRRGGAARSCSASSRSPAGSRATPRPRRRARSTRAASSATRSRTPSAPPSTTRIWSSPASSATARPRRARSRPAGTANKFLNARTDGAVLPILHLNGYKIANPTVLARIPEHELVSLLEGYGWRPARRRGRRAGSRAPGASPAALDEALDEIARDPAGGAAGRRRRTAAVADDRPADAEGLDRPQGGRRPAGRGHLARRTRCRSPTSARTPITCACSRSGCAATGPRSCSTKQGRLVPELAELPPRGARRMSANPHANGGELLQDLVAPDFRDYAVDVPEPGTTFSEATRVLGGLLRDVVAAQPGQLPHLRAGRDRLEPARRRASRSRTRPGRRRSSRRTRTSRRRGGSSRCSPSTSARAGSRATC